MSTRIRRWALAAGLLGFVVPGWVSAGADQYRFERLWPVLQQPWYFIATGLAVDDQGFIYVGDFDASRVQKFTLQGQYITQWGSPGSGPGQFNLPQSVVVDSNGDVYVADRTNNRVQKFTNGGQYLTEFGSAGTGPGEISLPRYIAIDGLDAIYVVELGNSRISKFVPPAGDDPSQPHEFDFSFGSPGLGPGEFTTVATAIVDEIGNIFVASHGGDRIQKFDADGQFLLQFGTLGSGPGEFRNPRGLAINQNDELLVGDSANRIQVFDLNGTFLREISPILDTPGTFLVAGDIDILPSGELVLADLFSGDIVKTSADGVVQTSFSSQGLTPSRFQEPTAVDVTNNGQIVVSHVTGAGQARLQTFSADGQYQSEYSVNEALQLFALRDDGGLYGANGPTIYLYDPPASGQPEDPPELNTSIFNNTFLTTVILVGNDGEDQLVLPGGNLEFSPPNLGTINTQTGITQSIAVADLDGDRQLDLIFGRAGQNAFLIGDFPDQINTEVALGAAADDTRALAALDVDGNGTVDIVTANANAANRVLLNNGAASFSAGVTFGAGDDSRALAAADIDLNGTVDLFVGNAAGQSRIYLGDGSGGFTQGPVIGGPSESIVAAGFADVDRNGTFDLVVGRNGVNQLYRNTGGSFAAPISLTDDAHDTRSLAFVDINTDGYVDVIAGNFDQVNRYYLNDGTGIAWTGNDVGQEAEPTTSVAVYLNNIFPVLVVGNSGQADRVYFRSQFDSSSPFRLSTLLPDQGALDTRALATAPDLSQRVFGELAQANSLVLSSRDQLYVHDFRLRKILRYNSDGQVMAETSLPQAPGEAAVIFNGVTVDNDEKLYVTDGYNNRVYRFAPPTDLNSNDPHTLEASFGEAGTGAGQLDAPTAIQVLESGNLAIADGQKRIQIFSSQGQFLSSVGQSGSTPGAFGSVDAMAELDDGRLVTVDRAFSRVQTFNPQLVSDNTKVIMVAGGGPYPGNALWDATQNNANFAYRVLVSQGFTKDTIFYLSDDTDLDLDGNGLPDDVDGAATVANLNNAFNNFAADAENLVVYLIDHGGLDTYRMSGTETLSAGAFGSLLDSWQGAGPSRSATVIYDACQSGSFLDETRSDQFDRIVITSSGADENAYFVSQGTLSFSNQFWTHIFNGLSLEDAFSLAAQTQSTSFPEQTPMVEADGDGQANSTFDLARLAGRFIGNGTQIFGSVPEVGSVNVSPASGSSATVDAMNVTDSDGIGRVWMVLRPPGFNPGSADNPVQDLPTVELARDAGTDNYSATFNGFVSEGTYQITVYAQDAVGNTAVPQVAFLTIENPLRRKAIIVAGGESADPKAEAIRINAALAYGALLQQGYGPDGSNCNQSLCDDIQYLSNTGIVGLDAAATLSNLDFAITDWATQEGQDLVLYLVGISEGGGLRLNDGEVLTALQLNTWLNAAQAALPGAIVVVYDGELSGDFVAPLAPPAGEDRVVIASDGDTLRCNLVLDEDISFSRFFWGQVLNGATVRQAFSIARQGIRFSERSQSPVLDDNGNGIGNEFTDGIFARNYSLGSGVLLAGDEPLVASVNAPATIDGVTAVELVANGVTSTGEILSVEAIVTLPNCEEVRLPMQNTGAGSYSVQTQIFSDFSGVHDVAVVARDDEGLSSLPAAIQVDQLSGSKLFADGFE